MNFLRKRRHKAGAISATVEGFSEYDSEDNRKPTIKSKEKEVVLHQLKSNECRMTPDNKVTCPFCQAKLGVPRGSEPPFKFTCPQCDKKIRVVENQKF
jgi:transcription initiation factor IIE alpha subunit